MMVSNKIVCMGDENPITDLMIRRAPLLDPIMVWGIYFNDAPGKPIPTPYSPAQLLDSHAMALDTPQNILNM